MSACPLCYQCRFEKDGFHGLARREVSQAAQPDSIERTDPNSAIRKPAGSETEERARSLRSLLPPEKHARIHIDTDHAIW